MSTILRLRRLEHPAWVAPLVFCAAAAVYLPLGSNDFTFVDGALRCLEPFRDDGGLLHGNNHLLYPLWVVTWIRLLRALRWPMQDPMDIIGGTQVLNGLLAAASVALVYSMLARLGDRRVAVAGSLVVGLSAAMLSHATSSAEPMPGLFYALLGTWIVMSARSRLHPVIPLLLSGACFALAMASYQAMATVAAVAAFLVLWGPAVMARDWTRTPSWRHLWWVALGGGLGVAVIYGSAYASQGTPVSEMPARFLALGGSPGVYSGFRLARAANVPFGLLENSYDGLPSGYTGLRALASGDPWSRVPLIIAGLALWGATALLTADGWRRLARTAPRGAIVAALVALGLTLFPLLYWDPLYDKLWLLPLVVLTCAVAVAIQPGVLPDPRRRLLLALVAGIVGLQALGNLPDAIARHTRDTPYLAEARAVAAVVRPTDSVVAEFDPVSSLWRALFRDRQRVLLLPASTLAEADAWLRRADEDLQSSRLLFIGVLDVDRHAWDDFLGTRVGIPYELLDRYRAAAVVVQTFELPRSRLTVRLLDRLEPQPVTAAPR